MLLDGELIATVGAATLGGVETLKRFFPGILPKVSGEAKAAVFSLATATILKVAGVGIAATLGWLPLLISAAIGAVAAGVTHDKVVVPLADPILNQVPGQETKS